ncbi:MAG TPA: MFS transporter, partial [Mycobacterium sp.]
MATKGQIKAAASAGREPPPEAQQWDGRLRATIALLCGALFLDAMDVSSVNVALPTIGSHLGMPTTSLQWIVSAYVLGYGGFLLLGGRVSDLLGKKQVFLGALMVFAVASAVGGLADSGTVLIITRLVKGIAAAFTVPAGLSILTTTFVTDEDRHRALGAYASTGAAGFSLGLVIGGLLSELGWRYVFLVPVPVTA